MNRIVVDSLLFYKKIVSPFLPRSCRYSPTCSEFMRLAILEYGLFLGLALGAWRLVRCQPLHPGGIDLP